MTERWLLPAEMARRLGVSPKALRIYERAGLVAPLRTSAGWRAYAPPQMARLHQVLALKGLGLSLRRIGELLDGRLASLDAVLEIQQRALERRRSETDKALALLAAARARIARHGTLSADDLNEVTRETIMTDTLKTGEDWAKTFRPLVEKHFDPAARAAAAKRETETLDRLGMDRADVAAAWTALFEEARTLTAAGELASPRASDLVRRWRELISHFTGLDPEVERRSREIWSEATSDPAIAPRLPVSAEDVAFVQRIADGMRARGELPAQA